MRSLLRNLFRSRRLQHHASRPPLRAKSTAAPMSVQRKLSVTSSTAVVAALLTATVSEVAQPKASPEEASELRHHLKNGKGFANPWDSWREMPVLKIAWAILKRRITGEANVPDTSPDKCPTVSTPSFLPSRTSSPNLRATWLGHACYYVEFPTGLRVLFDPVFEERCSPYSWLGPKRYTAAPCQVEDIPLVDAVVISHSHYDHLSHPTVLALTKAHPEAHFFVPLRLKKWFLDSGVPDQRVTELDWWQEKDLILAPAGSSPPAAEDTATTTATQATPPSTTRHDNTIKATISCLPSQHTSARSPFDRAVTLWASWSITSGAHSIWFGGDTGYRAVPFLPASVDDWGPDHASLPTCPAFRQIGAHRGPFDLALIPIGAYDPRWIMSPQHCNPRDAVEVFEGVRAKRAMGIHWGTWILTEEEVMEPVSRLKEVLKAKGIAEERFGVCGIGESREFPKIPDDESGAAK